MKKSIKPVRDLSLSGLKSKIREVPDYPKKGINFKDITPLLEDAKAFKFAINKLAGFFKNKKTCPERSRGIKKVVGIDARGFLLASAVAYKLNAGLVIVRKKGKLPSETITHEYDLEYGKDTIEMHKDAIKPNERVIIIDDVLATGGTAEAAGNLVEKLKGKIVGFGFLIDLSFLRGRERLKKYKVYSLISY